MNTILRHLTNEMYNDKNNYFVRTIGNYRVVRNIGFISHYYFGSRICFVDLNNKQFAIHHCGYKNYKLTTAQLNYLRQFYKNKGYELIYDGE